ncbi:putative sugar ABC transporter permease protein [Ilumatobacter coccineus YM16-304]|uniref:Putative sugar ABC transporter permease protein n=2 Tax=Ilumatobacter coccineus TaxID=467094 RepID=A0A6C7DXA8_ILUCY|nr:sugar ABC transporter permease [Ilumatobacter coccineus]BAN01074.1 putative sugar ABC transporter permease protein [Ilumatobacter coccineus YM16-304]
MTRRRIDASMVVMAAPFVLGIVALVVVPAMWTVALSLYEWDLVSDPTWRGLDTFRELFADDVFRISLRNSIAFVVVSVPLRMLGVVAFAMLLHRRQRGDGPARTAVLLPTFIPDIAYGLVWLWIANPLYGPLNVVLDSVGAPTPSWFTDPGSAKALVVLMSLFTIGEGIIIAIAVRNQIRPEFYELAAVEGVGSVSTFRRVTLPLMAPALLVLAMRDAAFAFQASFVPALVVTEGGPPPFSTTYLPLFAYRNSFEYLRYGYGAAVTVVMLGVTVLVLLVQRGFVRQMAADRV